MSDIDWSLLIGYWLGVTVGVAFAGPVRRTVRWLGTKLAAVRQLP